MLLMLNACSLHMDKQVQSVREVSRSENNRYLFEITMKNGKKKMLVSFFYIDQESVCNLCLRMWSIKEKTPEQCYFVESKVGLS